MVTVQRENGDALFFNENEFTNFSFLKDEKKFVAIPTQPTAHIGMVRETVEVEDVLCVAYTNEAQPTSLIFRGRSDDAGSR